MRSSPELLIQPYLARGERLLWTGRPRRAIAVQTGDYVGFGMALFGAAFMGREIVQVITDGAYGILPFLVPFAIVWIGIAAGQPLRRARRRRNAVYGLTDRRAIILEEASSEVQSVALVAEPIVALQTHRNGTGTILFGNQSREQRWHETGPAFRSIDDADAVYQRIQGLQARPPAGERPWA